VAAYAKVVAVREEMVKRHPDVPDYRVGLARGYDNLGNVLRDTGRSAEAEGAHTKAIAGYETLAAQQPKRPHFLSTLGLALHNLGRDLAARGRHQEAVARYRQAIGRQRPLFNRQPQVIQFRRFLSDNYQDLTVSLRALGQVDEAAETTRERVKLWPGNANELYNAACEFALCVPIGDDTPHKQSLADEAMATLRAAVAAGFSEGAWMSRDADLVPLRGRDDFRRLVLGLMDRAMPADPFVHRSGVGRRSPFRRGP
jgi:tetratricopeptide (TPR) repeat protein